MNLSIHQKWEKFSKNEQLILGCFVPFQGIIYYDYEGLIDYFKPLELQLKIPDDPFDSFYPLLQKAIELGLLQKASSDLAFLNIQPDFNLFLRFRVWVKWKQELKMAIIDSFLAYYQLIATDLYERIKSGVPNYYQEALMVLNLEYPNFMEATRLGIKLEKDIYKFLSVLSTYFIHHQYLESWLSFLRSSEKQISKVNAKPYFTTYIIILDHIGNTLTNLRQPKEAVSIFFKALEICEKSKEEKATIEKLKIAIYTNLGNAVTEREQQIKWQQKAYKLAGKIGSISRLGSIAYNLSEAFFQTKDIVQSRKYLEQGLNSFIESGDFKSQIKAYQSMAAHSLFAEDYQKAEENLAIALNLAQTIENKYNEAIIYQELASVYYKQNNLKKAMDYCKKAIPIFVKTKDIRQEANAYNLLSIIAFEARELEDGYTYANTAIQLFYQTDDKSQMAQIYGNLALIAYQEREYEECLSFLATNMDLYDSIDEQFNLEKSRLLKTSAFFELQEFEKSKTALLIALSFFIGIDNQQEIEHCRKIGDLIYKETADEHFKSKLETIATNPLEEKT